MQEEDNLQQSRELRSPAELVDVPEEPFGIRERYWKAGLILFSIGLMGVTVLLLIEGHTPHVIGALYSVPAILFAYFYRRRGVLIVYLLAMFYFGVVVLFRYPNMDDLLSAALRSALMIAIALTVSYLTHYLLMEKRKYHAIFDNTENGVVVANIHTHAITEMNQRFASIVCGRDATRQGLTFEEIAENKDKVGEIFAPLSNHCLTPAVECTLRHYDGSIWAAIIVGRKISSDHAVLTFIDITERRKIDAQLRQCNADTNLYLDILTHDINNINTASLSYGRLLETTGDPKKTDLPEKLVKSLEKSDEIIRNISTLRRIRETSVELVPVPLSGIISREIAGFPDVTINYKECSVTVLADEMLSSVFNNLIGNAIKFGGKDPKITILVEDQETDVVVSVADSGPGIPDSTKPRIFDRFERGDTTVSGKGLGLFICKTLVERYGGTIEVADLIPGAWENGTIFRFTLKKA